MNNPNFMSENFNFFANIPQSTWNKYGSIALVSGIVVLVATPFIPFFETCIISKRQEKQCQEFIKCGYNELQFENGIIKSAKITNK